MGCKPRIDSANSAERRQAVAGVTDPAVLAKVAQTDSADDVRAAAAARITDQAVLAKIAETDTAGLVTNAALQQLHDQGLLGETACAKRVNPQTGVAAVERITDPAVLLQVATADCDESIWKAAIKKITDQAALAKIALDQNSEPVRRAAIERLTDPRLLTDVAVASRDSSLQQAAADRVADPAQLVRLAIEHTDPDIVRNVIVKLTEPAMLAKVATEARVFVFPEMDATAAGNIAGVRDELLQKLTDQTLLATVAMETPDSELAEASKEKLTDPAGIVRVEALALRLKQIEGLTDEAELAAVVTLDKNRNLRAAALRRLTRQEVVAQVATSDPDAFMRAAAVARLADETLVMKVAKGDRDPSVRLVAIARVSDPVALARAATEDREPSVRRAAVGRLGDNAVLARIALGDMDPKVRLAAVEAMVKAAAGQAALHEVLVREKEQEVRLAALGGIDGQKDLFEIATTDRDPGVRGAATARLDGQADLARVATQDKETEVRLAAVERLVDQAVLGKIAASDEDDQVRQSAIKKVNDQAVLRKAALEDTSEAVRAEAIAEVKDQAALCEVALKDKSAEVRAKAAGRVENFGVVVKIVLEDKSRAVRAAALDATDRFGEPLMLLMQEALLNGNPAAKANACDALVHIGGRALPGLRQALDHPQALVRRYAAEALGRLDDKASARNLSAHLADNDDGVRRNAADAVAKLGASGVNEVLPLLPKADGTIRKYILFILARADALHDAAPVVALLTGDRETRWYAAHLLLAASATLDPEVASIKELISDQKYAEAAAAGPAGGVLCSAKLADWTEGPAVAEVLSKAGWKPSSDCERVLFAIARRARAELTQDWPTSERIILENVQLGDDAMIANSVYGAIGCGVTDMVPELEHILFASGTKEMAETYLNCGQGTLEEAARLWASEHGYTILPVGGSSPVTWGGL
jgi:HEAT repeat protein